MMPIYITDRKYNYPLDYGNSTFLFFASLVEKLNKRQSTPVAADQKEYSVLLADDDEDDRMMFSEAISKISSELLVKTVSNGKELLEELSNGNSPDVIFLDLNMPGKNGKECLVEIRNIKKLQHTPVIIYSTSSNQRDITETYTRGANLYLLKPSSFRQLISLIRKSLTIDWESGDQMSTENFLIS